MCSASNLQLVAELLRVRNKAAVRVSLVEPGAAPDLRRLLLPEHRGARSVVEPHVVTPSVCAYDHVLWVKLNWNNKNIHVRVSWQNDVTNFLPIGLTGVVRLLELQRVDDAERKPDALGLHLLAVEPVVLNGLVDVEVVRHHGTCRNDGSGGRSWRGLKMSERGLKEKKKTPAKIFVTTS